MTLAEGLPREIGRVAEMLPRYDDLPNKAGLFASTLMRQAIDKACVAIGTGDVVAQFQWYEELKGFEL